MRLRTLFICGWMLIAAQSLSAAKVHGPISHTKPLPAGPKIKVLLEKDATSAFLEAKGPYRVVRKEGGSILSSGKIGKRFVVHALPDGLRWGEEYPDVYQISIIPRNHESSLFVNGIQYKGAISIYHVRDNRITIINEVEIEDYLKSTLAVQYEEPLQQEAMAACAIAERTLACCRALQGQSISRPWDVTAQESGYYGFGICKQRNGIEEAVDTTRYMVLESIKQGGIAQNIQFVSSKANELAKKGHDAQKILQALVPQTKIASTIDVKEAVQTYLR